MCVWRSGRWREEGHEGVVWGTYPCGGVVVVAAEEASACPGVGLPSALGLCGRRWLDGNA